MTLSGSGTKAALTIRVKDIAMKEKNRAETPHLRIPCNDVSSCGGCPVLSSSRIGSAKGVGYTQSHPGHKNRHCFQASPSYTTQPITCLTKKISLPLWLTMDPECAKVRIQSRGKKNGQERDIKRDRAWQCWQPTADISLISFDQHAVGPYNDGSPPKHPLYDGIIHRISFK
jgi:hypothetical protein